MALGVAAKEQSAGMFSPLRETTFRTVWIASLLSNFGQLIQGVGAAWEMTRLTASPGMVALVQTAIMLPLMLLALPSGAIADMFDRRKVALIGLSFAMASAATLTIIAYVCEASPHVLLAFCFLIGTGVALYGPAWQSSVGEQVSAPRLPAAIALSSVSYNIARSFGPAVGGAVVAAFGAVAAFGLNAIFYLPLMIAFLRWRRAQPPSRLPPERLGRAILSGLRYVRHSPSIRLVVLRTFVSGLAGASVSALTPLVAKDLLHGGPGTYGLLLGSFGVGAVIGATTMGRARRVPAEQVVRLCAMSTGAMVALVGISSSLPLTCIALAIAGAGWMLLMALFNVGVQLAAPRWVTARALSCYQTAITGGMALGAFMWGQVAGTHGTGTALVISGIAVFATPLLGLLLPMPQVRGEEAAMIAASREPEVALDLTLRSGPVVIEVAYRVAPDLARPFYDAMRAVRSSRLRTGGFEWSLARDIADAALWVERYHCPTWGDYLRQRDRATEADREAQAVADTFNTADGSNRVRRRLERPFGSVRWRSDSPDPRTVDMALMAP